VLEISIMAASGDLKGACMPNVVCDKSPSLQMWDALGVGQTYCATFEIFKDEIVLLDKFQQDV
jgi:hypothetical protein